MDATALGRAFRRHYLELRGKPAPPFSISFYPYCGLSHTLRARQGRIRVRISDLLHDAPQEVLESLLAILLHRFFERPVPRAARRCYRRYLQDEATQRRALEARRQRGRKDLAGSRGDCHDLAAIFERLNRRHFEGRLEVRHLSWSRRAGGRVMGHYDRAHDAIVLNRELDAEAVPEAVVERVLLHEMLHAWRAASGSLTHGAHDARFRRMEQEMMRAYAPRSMGASTRFPHSVQEPS